MEPRVGKDVGFLSIERIVTSPSVAWRGRGRWPHLSFPRGRDRGGGVLADDGAFELGLHLSGDDKGACADDRIRCGRESAG